MQDYDKNNQPIVEVAPTKSPFKQKDENLAPVTKVAPEKSAYGEEIMPKNSVTEASSAKLQKASRLGGRVSISGGSEPFAN
jgi:hypothetical protein